MIRRFTLQALRTTPLVARQTLTRSIPKPLFTSLNLSTSSKSTSHSLFTPSEGKLTVFEWYCVLGMAVPTSPTSSSFDPQTVQAQEALDEGTRSLEQGDFDNAAKFYQKSIEIKQTAIGELRKTISRIRFSSRKYR